jgi:hypothetical protein
MTDDKFIYALEERIGNPDLFVGRKKEINYLNKWLAELPEKLSQSTAILSRRKKGKTAIVERFYNIIYNENSNVIPFYYEVREGSKWIINFSLDFYTSFLSQYIGFKLRDIDLKRKKMSLDKIEIIAEKNNIEVVLQDIDIFRDYYQDKEDIDNIWGYVQSAPHRIASITDDFIVQIIDEFQFMNSEIYWDREKENVADDLAGTYLSLAESKIAPMLVTGSWVGWLKGIIRGQLPARFKEIELGNFTEEEGLEAVLNYSIITGVEVANDVAVYLNDLVDSDPFYISAIIRSFYDQKDLTTKEGLLSTLEYEVRKGDIYSTWMEYILNTIDEVNDQNAKKIVFFLSKNREKEWTRQEIIKKCDLPDDERELEEKLRQLVKGDLIGAGSSSMRYKGMDDNIFYKVFRYRYQEEIDNFPLEKIEEEELIKEQERIQELKTELKTVKGREKYNKGYYLEYILTKYLKFGKFKENKIRLKDVVDNYQLGAKFTDYQQVKNCFINLEGGRSHQVDICALSEEEGQDLYIEVKNWEEVVGTNEVKRFINTVQDIRKIKGKQGFFTFYAMNGFTQGAKELLVKYDIMYSYNEKWKLEVV